MDNEINYSELFGLEETPEENENTENTETESADDTEEVKDAPPPAEEKAEVKQDAEERSRQAAGRRIREREAAARADERGRISAVLKRLGIEDSDGKAIDTVDELEAYEQRLSERRIASGKGTAEDIKRIVRDAIREEGAAPDKDRAGEAADEIIIKDQLRTIHGMDPDVNELADILRGPHADAFRDYVGKGLSFVDAYTLAARSKLDGIKAARAGSAEKTRAAGKAHLSATSQHGEGMLPVPPDEMELFRRLNPKATDAEIEKFYNADRKRFRSK